MADPFPNVSFDWLGKLPLIAEAAGQRQTTRETLSDLKSTDPASLESKAAQLMARGAFEEGLKLQDAALKQRQLLQKSEADRAMMAWWEKYRGTVPPAGGPAPSEPGTVDIPAVPPPAPPPALTIPGMPTGPLGPAPSQLPAPPPGTPSMVPAPGPLGATSTPSEEILAAAEGPPQAPPAGPRLAQAGGPVPGVVPGAAPAVPFLPGTPGLAPAPPIAPRPQVPMGGSPQETARQRAIQEYNVLSTLPPRAMSTPEGRARLSAFTTALTEAKANPNEISYQQERLRLRQEGKPDITRADFEADQKTVGERVQAMSNTYKGYQERETSARTLGDKLAKMREIMDNRRFAPGNPGYIDMTRNYIASTADTFRALGVPESLLPSRETLKSITEPNALRELFTSMANQAVTTGLGGLSKSISDADRNYLAAAYPALSQTKEGMNLIIEFLSEAANRSKLEAAAARKYGNERGVRGSQYGMDQAVVDALEKYGEENRILINKDDSRTALGKKIETIIGSTGGTPITPDMEGKTGTLNGKPFIIKNGQVIPADRM